MAQTVVGPECGHLIWHTHARPLFRAGGPRRWRQRTPSSRVQDRLRSVLLVLTTGTVTITRTAKLSPRPYANHSLRPERRSTASGQKTGSDEAGSSDHGDASPEPVGARAQHESKTAPPWKWPLDDPPTDTRARLRCVRSGCPRWSPREPW